MYKSTSGFALPRLLNVAPGHSQAFGLRRFLRLVVSPMLQIRAASSKNTWERAMQRVAVDVADQKRERDLLDESLAVFRRLDDKLKSTQQPDPALRVEHSQAKSYWLFLERKWEFADVTHGLTQLRMMLHHNPRINALEPAATKLVKLDFRWREDMASLKQIWTVKSMQARSMFIQQIREAGLRSHLIFTESIAGYSHIIVELSELEREAILGRRLPPLHPYIFLLERAEKRVKRLSRHLLECKRAYTEILVDRLKREDPRYWPYDAVLHPFKAVVAETKGFISRLRSIHLEYIRKTSPIRPVTAYIRHNWKQFNDMVAITNRLARSSAQLEKLTYEFEPFVARRVEELSGSELEERVERAKEVLQRLRERHTLFNPEEGEITLRPIRSFWKDYEASLRGAREERERREVQKRKRNV